LDYIGLGRVVDVIALGVTVCYLDSEAFRIIPAFYGGIGTALNAISHSEVSIS